MEGISDIRIVGLDERRPPRIRKEPYINLFFKLSHEAPADWCQCFNSLLAKHGSTPKIKPDEGLFIETWVRKPGEIEAHLELLKKKWRSAARPTSTTSSSISPRVRRTARHWDANPVSRAGSI